MRVLATAVMVTILTVSGAQAQDTLAWVVDSVFPTAASPADTGGPGVGVAFNPENERPVVALLKGDSEPGSYFVILRNVDASESDLWEYVGYPTSESASDLDMDFWISPTTWKLGISYRDRNNQALRFLETVFDRTTQQIVGTNWIVQDTESFEYGYGTAMKYDSTGRPHIAAHVRPESLGIESLLYATSVNSGGNCGAYEHTGKWNCQTIHSGDEVGRDPSLAIDGADEPVIGYTAPNGAVDAVWVARPTSSGAGSCGGGFWNCGYVNYDLASNDQSRAEVFFDHSAAATGLHVAYLATSHYSVGPTYLNHATWVGGGTGDCGYPLDWQCNGNFSGIEVAPGGDLAMGVNELGHPVVAYAADGHFAAMYVEDLDQYWAGNCGSSDRLLCSYLEDGYGAEMAEWLDLVVDSKGVPVVVYTHSDETFHELNVHMARPWIFRDSFESAELVVWSTSVK